MSIIAYTGLPGHGKSYGAVKHSIMPALESGRLVATNIPLSDDLDNQYPDQIQRFQTSDIEGNPDWFESVLRPGSVLVFDEVWRIWPAGLKTTAMPIQHKTFLAEHRHIVGIDGHSTEIVLIVQRLSNLASFCRNLIEYTYIVQKLETVGSSRRYRVDIYEGAARDQPNKRFRIREEYGKFDPKIFSLYQSHTRSDTAGREAKPDNRANILRSPILWVGVILVAILLIFVVIMAPHLFPTVEDLEQSPMADSLPTQPAEQPSVTTPPQKKQHAERHPIDDLLSEFDDGYITLFLRRGRRVEYTIRLLRGLDWVDMTNHQLTVLGAKIQAMDRCLLLVEGGETVRYFTCRSEPDRDGNETIVSDIF